MVNAEWDINRCRIAVEGRLEGCAVILVIVTVRPEIRDAHPLFSRLFGRGHRKRQDRRCTGIRFELASDEGKVTVGRRIVFETTVLEPIQDDSGKAQNALVLESRSLIRSMNVSMRDHHKSALACVLKDGNFEAALDMGN